MSGKSDSTKGRAGAPHKHGDKDLEKWAQIDKGAQHPGEFKGPLEEVDSAADVEEHRKARYATHRSEQKRNAEDPGRQHPGEFLGPLGEVDIPENMEVGKREQVKHQEGKDRDLEHWAQLEREHQHPGEFKGPLAEVPNDVEAVERRRKEYAKHRGGAKQGEADRQHPGEFKGPLGEVSSDKDRG